MPKRKRSKSAVTTPKKPRGSKVAAERRAAKANAARVKADVIEAARKVQAVADEAKRVSDNAAKIAAELAAKPHSWWRW